MAMSDYAYIAFGKDGSPTMENGRFGRIEIDPYKTWLYVRSPEIWKEGEAFTGGVIAQVDEGHIALIGASITVEGVELLNKEGIPYSTVKFFYCSYGYGESLVAYGGIVCYAWLAIETKAAWDAGAPKDADIFSVSSSSEGRFAEWADGSVYKSVRLDEKYQGDEFYDLAYCGITDDMIDAFLKWSVPDKDWLKKVSAAPRMWANQGDQYLAGALGGNPQQKVGEKQLPMLMRAMLPEGEPVREEPKDKTE